QIEQAIAIVVEEDGTGGVPSCAGDAGLLRDIREFSVSVVSKQNVACAHTRNEEIGIAIVVDIREGSADARAITDADTRARCYVFEASAAKIPIKTVLADLIDEIEIEASVAIDVCRGNGCTVVVVGRAIVFSEIQAVAEAK